MSPLPATSARQQLVARHRDEHRPHLQVLVLEFLIGGELLVELLLEQPDEVNGGAAQHALVDEVDRLAVDRQDADDPPSTIVRQGLRNLLESYTPDHFRPVSLIDGGKQEQRQTSSIRRCCRFRNPSGPAITEFDARKATAPPRFEIKAPANAPNVLIRADR